MTSRPGRPHSGRAGSAAVEHLALTAAILLAGLMVLALVMGWVAASNRLVDTITGWTLM